MRNRVIGIISFIGTTLLTIIGVLALFALIIISISVSLFFFLEGTDQLIKRLALPKNPLGFFVATLLLCTGICLSWLIYNITVRRWNWRIRSEGCRHLTQLLLMIMGFIGLILLVANTVSFFEYVYSGWLEAVIVILIWLVFGAFFVITLLHRERRR